MHFKLLVSGLFWEGYWWGWGWSWGGGGQWRVSASGTQLCCGHC